MHCAYTLAAAARASAVVVLHLETLAAVVEEPSMVGTVAVGQRTSHSDRS